MRFRKLTDAEDFNIRTLIWMAKRPEYWDVMWTWREWRLEARYDYYDGPLWQVRIGPLCILLSHL